MRTSKLKYVLTWLALALLLVSAILLVASAWNNQITGSFSPVLLLGLWIAICASGIYLFLLAVKKAHRLWIDEKREQERMAKESNRKSTGRSEAFRENKALDFTTSARKIIRRIPENIAEDQLGKLLLKTLSRELEIMSGVYYSEDKGAFRAVSTYAMTSLSEPYTFKTGEGLTGQAARNQQTMVLTRLPEEYLEVFSGLGKAAPSYLAIVPFVHRGKTIAVLECAGYRYEPEEIENMFRILARDLMDKRSPNLP
jgi:hypothetical protein